MKKHSVTMVILLILTLSFMGVVSASENVTDCAMTESYQYDAPIEVAEDVELSDECLESAVPVSTDSEDVCDNVSVDELISYSLESEEDVAASLDDGEISDCAVSTAFDASQFEDADGGYDNFEKPLIVSCVFIGEDSESNFMLFDDGLESIISIAFEGEIQAKVIDSNWDYDDNYKLGYDLTTAGGELLDHESADEVLVITNAGFAKISNLTVRDVLNIIVDSSNGYVKYGKSNLLTWSSRNTNSEYIAFFIKRGGSLFVALYDQDMNPVYVGDASLKTSAGLWSELHDSIGEDYAYICSVIVSSWANGVSGNVLYPALDSGENIIQTLKFNLPENDSGLPLADAPYDVLGVPGITDDAFIWSNDLTPGKIACISDIMVKESVTKSVRWTSASQTGMLSVLSFESEMDMFGEETDLSPDVSANNSLKYRKLSNPTSTGDILARSENLTQVLSEVCNEDTLADESVYETDYSKELDISTPDQLRQIGVEAGEKAVAYFKSKDIDIQKNNQDLYLLTSAGHVKINGMDTWIVFDGLEEGLGFKLSEKSLLPLHTSLWKDLVFYFFWIDSATKNITSYGLRYSQEDGCLVAVDSSAQLSEYADYILGLYEEHSNGNGQYYNGYEYKCWDVFVDGDALPSKLSNVTLANKTSNSTKLDNNKSDNASNVTTGANFDNITKRPGQREAGSSPYNILYTLGSILVVCMIFFSGYSKP